MRRKRRPGCPCCCPAYVADCTLNSDSFGSDTSADYSATGTWSISSGLLRTSGNNAMFIYDTDLPSDHVVIAYCRQETSWVLQTGREDNLRVILGYTDADNYLFGNLRTLWEGLSMSSGATAYLSLWSRVAGVETELRAEEEVYSGSVDGGTYSSYRVALCWYHNGDGTGNLAYGTNNVDDNYEVEIADSSPFGLRAGVGTGTIQRAEVQFDHLDVAGGGDECPNCSCQACLPNTNPSSITIEFSGVENGDCGSECEAWNTTAFVLDRGYIIGLPQVGGGGYLPSDGFRDQNDCNYVFDLIGSGIGCGSFGDYYDGPYYRKISAGFACSGHGASPKTNEGFSFLVTIWRPVDDANPVSGAQVIVFRYNSSCCKVDCAAEIVGKTLTLISATTNDGACEWANATCTITAVS